MLKVTYTSTGLCLEYRHEPLDTLLADRVRLHTRSGLPLIVQPTSASIPLPATLPGLRSLSRCGEVQVSACDRGWVEVSIAGTWLATDIDQETGVFMTELRPGVERQLFTLWKQAQTMAQHSAWAVF
ncbi:MAG: hypothetical protein HC812_09330 [Leptolyngbya sp. RL_3_1]|nr:hypothetical protein [Leptolyngbya sp. RL_3_1]